MRGELFEPGGCSAWPTSACAIATMRAAAELPAGAAAGATVPVAVVPSAPEGVAVGVAPVTEAVRSICAKSSEDGVAVVVVVVAGAAVAGAVGPPSSVLICAIRAMAVSRLIPLPTSVLRAGALTPASGDNVSQRRRAARWPPVFVDRAPPSKGPAMLPLLLEQGQDRLRGLGGLREHARAGLLEDLVLRALDHLRRHVHVADTALGRHQVLLVAREVVEGVLETVLHRTEGATHGADILDGLVDRRNRGRRRDVDLTDGAAHRRDLLAQGRRGDADHVTVVGADLERDRRLGTVKQLDAVEIGGLTDPLDLAGQLGDLGGDGSLVRRGERAVLVLDGQLAHALQHRVDLVQRTLSGLHEADRVLSVALGLAQATNLTTKLLANGEAGRVVGCPVDAITRAEALHRLARATARADKLTVGVERLDVAVDTKGHIVFSLMTVGVIWSSRGNSLSPLALRHRTRGRDL